jgi:methyl-accepting chemotaxis protein
MLRSTSFGQKVAACFSLVALLAIASSAIATYAVRAVLQGKDTVINVNATRLLEVSAMRAARERRAKLLRSYLITRNEAYLVQMRETRDELAKRLIALRDSALSADERDQVERVEKANGDMQAVWDGVVTLRQRGSSLEEVLPQFEKGEPMGRELDMQLDALYAFEASLLDASRSAADETGEKAMLLILVTAVVATATAGGLAWLLARGLTRHVGSAVTRIQSSSAELSSASKQQAASSKELAATTVEIATTTRQLLAMSRQISQSARRAAQTAEDAGGSARAGDAAVQRAKEALTGIRRQVEVIVDRMRSLGSKSQRVGGILELINELAEQTNILAINATIESASTGEAGKRFAVVAAEIRRLADRVGDSAREIRGLIDEIRAAAATTAAATEDGSKAVELGSAQFTEVMSTFKHIMERVTITAEVAREIELSIQQQTTAVEQVSSAITEVAAASKESEASCAATLSTSSELSGVSEKLAALVKPS